MWSASSTTLISTSLRWQCPCSMRSASRPGQATTMSTRLRSAVTCAFCPMPPNMVVTVRFIAAASGAITACTWVASSRVGTRTRPRGWQARVCPSARPATSGIANPSVLPEPVRPRPRMSRPASESGRVAAWIGNGVRMPVPVRTSTSGAGTPKSAKVMLSAATSERPAGADRGAGAAGSRPPWAGPAWTGPGWTGPACMGLGCVELGWPVPGWPAAGLPRPRRRRRARVWSIGRAVIREMSPGLGWPHLRAATSVETSSLTERRTTGAP